MNSSENSVASTSNPQPDENTIAVSQDAAKNAKAPEGNAVVESATIGPDSKLVIVCTPRASKVIAAAAWLRGDGDIAECLTDMLKDELECYITDWPDGLFPEPKESTTAAA